MPTPEEQARQTIDRLLTEAGWQVQDRNALNLGASRGVAVREFPLQTGFADYMLFVEREAAGVIEAKAEGTTLSGVAEVERRLSVVGELEKQVEAALRRAERLRQAILKHAFEGKLVPQDPNDEPALALLARIKAERSGKGKKKAKEGKLEQLTLM